MFVLDLHVVEKGRAFCARDSSEEALGLRVPDDGESCVAGGSDYCAPSEGGGSGEEGLETAIECDKHTLYVVELI